MKTTRPVHLTSWPAMTAAALFLVGGLCVWALGSEWHRYSSPLHGFTPPRSGPALNRYFGYDNGRAAVFGNRAFAAMVSFSPYAGRHQNAALRWIARVENWGEAYDEVAEFVPAGPFLYNTGWYPGGSDNMYHPGDFGWNLARNFASIHVRQCTIKTPAGLFDITSMIDPSLGEPYALSVIPPYSYHLHCEADLIDDDSGTLLFQFVHDQRWDPPRMTFNPLFHGRQNRPAIRQTESWWDSRQVTLLNSGASYALDLGCFWQVFSNHDVLAGDMLSSWKL